MECFSSEIFIVTMGIRGWYSEINTWNLFLIESQMLANLYGLLFYINPYIRSHFQAWNYNSVIYSNSILLLQVSRPNVLRAFAVLHCRVASQKSPLSLSLLFCRFHNGTDMDRVMQNNRQFRSSYVSRPSVQTHSAAPYHQRDVSVNIGWHQIRDKGL
jgi:hypothetical protein